MPVVNSSLRLGAVLLAVLATPYYALAEISFTGGAGTTVVDTLEKATVKKVLPNGVTAKEYRQINAESGELLSRYLEFNWAGENYFAGASLYNADGDIKYEGESNNNKKIPNGSTYLYIWRTNTYFGKTLKELPLTPRIWVELGGQLKERHITTNVADIAGYQEDFTWWTAGAGLELHLLSGERYTWDVGGLYRSMLAPTNNTSNLKINVNLGDTSSYNLYTQLSYELGDGFYLQGLAGFTETLINVSRVHHEGNDASEITQPDSTWDDIDLMLKVSRRY